MNVTRPNWTGSVSRWLAGAVLLAVMILATGARAQERVDVSAFVGDYSGEAMLVSADGTKAHRNLSVRIRETDDGFIVAWSTVTQKPSGKTKESSYEIEFLPTDREGIYSAAQRRNVFGHAVQLDPMKGEPFVWGRIDGDTMTVYSLFVDDAGGYELQQYDRTIAEGGLQLEFSRLRNGVQLRTVSAFLDRG